MKVDFANLEKNNEIQLNNNDYRNSKKLETPLKSPRCNIRDLILLLLIEIQF